VTNSETGKRVLGSPLLLSGDVNSVHPTVTRAVGRHIHGFIPQSVQGGYLPGYIPQGVYKEGYLPGYTLRCITVVYNPVCLHVCEGVHIPGMPPCVRRCTYTRVCLPVCVRRDTYPGMPPGVCKRDTYPDMLPCVKRVYYPGMPPCV